MTGFPLVMDIINAVPPRLFWALTLPPAPMMRFARADKVSSSPIGVMDNSINGVFPINTSAADTWAPRSSNRVASSNCCMLNAKLSGKSPSLP